MRSLPSNLAASLPFTLALFGPACSDFSGPRPDLDPDPDPVITMTTPNASVTLGATADLAVEVTGAGPDDVEWSSDSPAIASVDEGGVVEGISVGQTRVVASLRERPSIFALATVTVTAPRTPPTAATLPADQITAEGARLRGEVNPNGLTTTVWFEWGQVGGTMGMVSTLLNPGDGTEPVEMNAVLGGLAPASSYEYRVVASNADGMAKGEVGTFVTDPAGSAFEVGTSAMGHGRRTLP